MFNLSKNMKIDITKILTIVLLSTLIVTLPQNTYAASNTIKLYDINKDGKTNFSDLMLIMQQIYMNRNSTPSKEVISVELNKTSLEIEKGNKEKLEAKITPENLSDKKLTWKSENTDIATVDDTGTVEAIEEGTTQITVQTENGKSASCTIMVINTEMKLNETNIELNVGETKEIYVENMKDEPLIWSSSDPTIVSISQTKSEEEVSVEFSDNSIVTINRGIEITALKEGSTEIEVKTTYNKTAKCTITVKNTEPIPEEEPKTEEPTEPAEPTEPTEPVPDTPSTPSEQEPTPETPDTPTTPSEQEPAPETPNTPSTPSEQEPTPDTPSTSPEQTTPPQEGPSIEEPVEATKITLNETKIELVTGNTTKLQATISPDYAINKTVIWSSADTNIATVTEDGIVKAISKGNTTITAETTNGKTATCYIVVNNPEIEVEYISLSRTSIELNKDYSLKLQATITPGNATNRSITWTSADTNIATVTEDGVVKAISKGTTTITATSSNGKTATCQVVVTEPIIEVQYVTLNKSTLNLTPGKTENLQATITPGNAVNKTLTWTSSNTNVATVTSTGEVKAISEGSTTITVKATTGEAGKCTVIVKKEEQEVTKITLNKTNLTLEKGESERLIATVEPQDAKDKEITWTSSNSNIAKVDTNGNVTAVSKGNAIITVRTKNGTSISCFVTVKEPNVEPEKPPVVDVTGIYLSKSKLELLIGKSEQITATITPTNATNKEVKWTTSNAAIATVSSNGTIKAISEGTATITVTSQASGDSAQCFVTVKDGTIKATNITLNETNITLEKGKTQKLTATITPTNTTDKTITWSSSNTNILTVETDGTITAKSEGTASITATTSNGLSAVCYVEVIKSAPEIVIDGQTITVPEGDKLYFLDTIYREDGKKDATGISNDCIIIESNGEYAMIDTGKLEINYRIKNYLKELGITELKWVLITHSHTDHIGGVKNAKTNIYEQVKVDTLYIKNRSKSPDYKKVYNNTVQVAKDHNTKVVDPNTISNKEIKVGNITFKLFNTQDRLGKKVSDTTEEDINSIVAAANISGKRVYLAGDLGRDTTEGRKIVTDITKQVMDYFEGKRINLYKAANHGYDNVHQGFSSDLLTKQLKNPYNLVVTSYQNDSRGKIITNYINKTAKAGYYTARGTVIANISNEGELTFKQLANHYTYALPK